MIQVGKTKQDADADAKAKQNAVNANAPVSILGGDLSGSGSSSANQTAHNNANADASNESTTGQDAKATQIGGDSSCWSGCGGNGQEQNVIQIGKTKQDADADAKAKQNAVNANAPLLVVGGDPSSGSSSASQDVGNEANAHGSNSSTTHQDASPTQIGGESHCWSGCGGNGQEQNVIQIGKTKQHADADAKAKQDAVNADAPGSILGDDPSGSDSSSAEQTAHNNANSDSPNRSETRQEAHPVQTAPKTICGSGCGGRAQEQNVLQKSKTHQRGRSKARGRQEVINF